MFYTKDKSSAISFPLGGIGSGCIGLAGNGGLCDWEIFNRSNKNSLLGYTHFCIRANRDFRILQGDCFEPYTGKYRQGDDNKYHGFGWGVEENLLPGLPHFRNTSFEGRFPVAQVMFSGEEESFPLLAELTAWSPFIPGQERESSLPCAVFEYTFVNTSNETVDCSAVGVLANPWQAAGHRNYLRESGNILTLSDGGSNELSLTLLDVPENISHQEYLFRGSWVDSMEMYLVELAEGGRFRPRSYPENPDVAKMDHGLLADHFVLEPQESRKVTFIISWHIPERRNFWNPKAEEEAAKNGVVNSWRNYYAVQWPDSEASAGELIENIAELRRKTMLFAEILHRSDLDPAIVDGASACLSTLRSPTCLRLEDGTLYGWEGVGTSWGSCEGSCIHVWNYAQATAFLFPALERSMNESHLLYSVDESGAAHFRLHLPLGIKAEKDWFRACADGQFGLIMKCFRDWKISGDTVWLKKFYPVLKKMMQYTWSSGNPDFWDPEMSGVLTGRQHHTLDMELFGANSWLTGFYLGALQAMVKMSEACDDSEFAGKCRNVLEKGREAVKDCFNGNYFCQKIDLKDHSILDRWEDSEFYYWNKECGELKYQISNGVAIDACLGEFFASFYGIGSVLDEKMTLSTLQTIYTNNFRSMREHVNPWRSYAVNDEKGVCICSCPTDRPAIPLPYNSEMMNGFEWAFAAHLVLCGMSSQAVEIARAVRDRYDGRRRNPWNEFECGNNYARSMAAYALIPAACGFCFDMNECMLGFLPKVELKRCFWSIGTAWGEFRDDAGKYTITLAAGKLILKKLLIPGLPQSVLLNGKEIAFACDEKVILLDAVMQEGDELQLS